MLELELAVDEAIAFALELDDGPYPGATGALDMDDIILLDDIDEPYPGATGALVVEAIIVLDVTDEPYPGGTGTLGTEGIILLDIEAGIELAMELDIAVLDIAIVEELPPMHVPNIGLQLPVLQ